VPSLLRFYHWDGDSILRSPLAHIVIDDARRYLERTGDRFDVIVVDPPPPVEAAASSLLYSTEFYAAARHRLKPGGILQQWLPEGERPLLSAVAQALTVQFPYVRAFHSLEGWGFHFLASDRPIAMRSAAEVAARMPLLAACDLTEWGPEKDAAQQLARVIRNEIPINAFVNLAPEVKPLSDDLPVNEYYFLRRFPRPSEADYLH
jgi:spermidine synthase